MLLEYISCKDNWRMWRYLKTSAFEIQDLLSHSVVCLRIFWECSSYSLKFHSSYTTHTLLDENWSIIILLQSLVVGFGNSKTVGSTRPWNLWNWSRGTTTRTKLKKKKKNHLHHQRSWRITTRWTPKHNEYQGWDPTIRSERGDDEHNHERNDSHKRAQTRKGNLNSNSAPKQPLGKGEEWRREGRAKVSRGSKVGTEQRVKRLGGRRGQGGSLGRETWPKVLLTVQYLYRAFC